ncbi:MAG: helix-turn-helix domain-containing protein [Pseudomonadota bacterium]
MLVLSHKIQIKQPTFKQEQYFRQACGTSRFAYNWGLARVGCVLPTGYKVPRRLVRGTHPTLALGERVKLI